MTPMFTIKVKTYHITIGPCISWKFYRSTSYKIVLPPLDKFSIPKVESIVMVYLNLSNI